MTKNISNNKKFGFEKGFQIYKKKILDLDNDHAWRLDPDPRQRSVSIRKHSKVRFVYNLEFFKYTIHILGDPEVTANIYCKSRNLPNTDTQNYTTDLR